MYYSNMEIDDDMYFALTVIKVLVECGVNYNQMTRIFAICSVTDKTLKSMHEMALRVEEAGGFRKCPNSEGHIELQYVGDSRDLEYLDTVMYHNDCGGGRRAKRSEGDSEA